jgi:hypothetical protein
MNTHRFGLRSGRRARGDDGATLVLVGLGLVVLVIFVAFAVDLGRAYGERRQDQSSVDSAALSAAYQKLFTTSTSSAQIFDEVVRISYKDLDPNNRPATEAAWRAEWPGCDDPDGEADPDYRNGELNVSGVGRLSCIRIASSGKAIRVKLPQRSVQTFFAGVMGIKSLSTTAVAEAGLSAIRTGVLPFVIGPFSGAGVVCLLEPPSGLSPDDASGCDGPTSGKFGYMASPRPSWDANQACIGGQSVTIQQNIAQGLDHNLEVWTGTDVRDVCTGAAVQGVPNTVDVKTGAINSTVLDGLITAQDEGGSFADGGPARLVRTSVCGTRQHIPNWSAYQLEWCGVWSYMEDFDATDVAGGLIPQSCLDLKTVSTSQNLTGVRTCMEDYAAGGYTEVLFKDTILQTNRFGWVPETLEELGTVSGSSTYYHLAMFRPVFLQTIYTTGGCGPSSAYQAYDPGQALPSGTCNSFKALSALAFDPNMLPDVARTPYGSNNRPSPIALLK